MGNLAIRCEVCGLTNKIYNDEYVYVEKIVLVGGFNVSICNKCRNEFHEFYNGNSEFDAYRDFVAEYFAAKALNDAARVTANYRAAPSIEIKMFQASKDWVEAHPKLDWDKKGQKVLDAPDSEEAST